MAFGGGWPWLGISEASVAAVRLWRSLRSSTPSCLSPWDTRFVQQLADALSPSCPALPACPAPIPCQTGLEGKELVGWSLFILLVFTAGIVLGAWLRRHPSPQVVVQTAVRTPSSSLDRVSSTSASFKRAG